MKLDIYASQTEIEKTYEVDTYDVMYGTVEDILNVMDAITDESDTDALIKAVSENREKLNALLKDVFPGLTDEELRRVKMRDLVPLFLDLFAFIGQTMGGNSKN